MATAELNLFNYMDALPAMTSLEHKQTETPQIKQYREMKRKHPNAILLFRVGNFYETFSEDAVTVSDTLGITLTRRYSSSPNNPVYITGFPHHALDTYLPKIIRAGKQVAICEQLPTPA